MAAIDDLIARVADPDLRAALQEQARRLTSRREFGLVFQDHLPERVEVPGLRARRGDLVRLRGGDELLLVTAAAQGVLTVAPTDAEDGEPTTVPSSDVVVVKDFGQPIYAGLKPLASIARGGDKPSHVVIQGENYYALETLLYTHEGKVDVIYIDPPYNTGSSTWIYNDRFVDDNDAYRHSRWLAFMQRRLEHARRLLKPTGVIIVAIDDTEHARLKLLLDQVFGEHNFVANIVWQGNVKNDARFDGGGLDYMLIYGRAVQELVDRDIRWVEEKPDVDAVFSAARDAWEASGGDAELASRQLKRWWSSQPKDSAVVASKHYSYVDDARPGEPYFASPLMSPNLRPNLVYDLRHPITGRPFRTPANGWRYARESMSALISAGGVRFGKDETTLPTKKVYLRDVATQTPTPSFREDRRSAGRHLEEALGSREFPFPKNVEVVARWIQIVSDSNPAAVVVDFFAGTGTTAEAVMRLNAGDGGRRQSIIVTNNELGKVAAAKLAKAGFGPGDPEWEAEGVFQKVTWPRVETVVTGTRRDGSTYSDGLAENVEFFQLAYEDPDLVQLGRRFESIARLLWLKAGAVGPIIGTISDSGWALPDQATYGVLFDEAAASPFVDAVLAAGDRVRHAFIVTDSESAFQAIAKELPAAVETSMLYGDYLRAFRINGKD